MSKIHMFVPHSKGAVKLSFDANTFAEYNKLSITTGNLHSGKIQPVVYIKGKRAGRFIMQPPEHLHVDHIDRNPLNNCSGNLRLATPSDNGCNKAKMPHAKHSKYKGVEKVPKRSKPWMARITYQKKRKAKLFATEIEAAIQYNKWAAEIHGEFAVLNVIAESK